MRSRRVAVHVGGRSGSIFMRNIDQSEQLIFIGHIHFSLALHIVAISLALPNFEVAFAAVNQIAQFLHVQFQD